MRTLFKGAATALLFSAAIWGAPVLAVYSQASGVPCTPGSWGWCELFPAQSSPVGPVVAGGGSTSANGNVNVSVRADYGDLGVVVRTASEPGGSVSGAALAFMQDTWTIGGGTPGTSGTLEILVSMSGSFEFRWSQYLGFYVGIDWPGGTPNHIVDLACPTDIGCRPLGAASPYSATGSLTRSITFGSPLDVVLSLVGQTGASNGQVQSINAWNSAKITGFVVRDSGGAVVRDFTLTANSGHDYLTTGGAVPEPSSIVLWAAGLALLLGKAVARHKAGKSGVGA